MKSGFLIGFILSALSVLASHSHHHEHDHSHEHGHHDHDEENHEDHETEGKNFKLIDAELHDQNTRALCNYPKAISQLKLGNGFKNQKESFDFDISNKTKNNGLVYKKADEIEIQLQSGKLLNVFSKNKKEFNYVEFSAKLNFNDEITYSFGTTSNEVKLRMDINSKDKITMVEVLKHEDHFHKYDLHKDLARPLSTRKTNFSISIKDSNVQFLIDNEAVGTAKIRDHTPTGIFFSIKKKGNNYISPESSTMIVSKIKTPCEN